MTQGKFDNPLKKLSSRNLCVAVVKKQMVGLAGLIREDDSAEIEPIVVKDTYRGTGAGTMLIEHIIQVAKANKLEQLTVRPVAKNRDAIRFFHSSRFETQGKLQLILDFRENASRRRWMMGPRLFDGHLRL